MIVQDASSNLATIGFLPDGTLDTATLLSFAAGGTVKVRNWLNGADPADLGQSLNTTNFAQMPTIVSSGTLVTDVDGKPALDLLSVQVFVFNLNLTPSNRVIYIVGDFDATSGNILGLVGNVGLVYYGISAYDQPGSGGSQGPAFTTGTKTLLTFSLQNGNASVYQDGVLQATGLPYLLTQNNVAGIIAGSTNTISEFIVYEQDDGSNIDAINSLIMTYYNIS
jgi:hypothetical protein